MLRSALCLAGLAGLAAAQSGGSGLTFAGFANKTACKSTPCGGYASNNPTCCEKLTSSVGACGCSMYEDPQGIPNATNATWAKVDWPLDDICAQAFPGSRAATMIELTQKIANIPKHTPNITKPCVPQNGGCEPGTNVSLWGTAWVVPGCLGAREGKWTPFADSTKTWFCSQETSGAYRWSLPPGTDLTAVTAGEGWNASAVNSSSGQACHKPYTSTCSKPYYEGDMVGSFYCADEHRELPGAITAVCVTGGSGPAPPPPAPAPTPTPTPPAPAPTPTPTPPAPTPTPPAPTPTPPAPAPTVTCDPKATPPENCPGGKSCPQCGKPSCPCPKDGFSVDE